jgi:PhnB protein
MTLGATLYLHQSNDAVEFYRNAFNMTTGYSAKNDDGTYMHAELVKDGKSIFAVSEFTDDNARDAIFSAKRPAMSLGIDLNNDDELRHAYEITAAEGHVLRPLGPLPWSALSADVVDKFGVCWYLFVSQHTPENL